MGGDTSSPGALEAVILAAGVGRRMGGDRPKVMLELGGISLLRRHLSALADAGVCRATLVIGYGAGQILSALQPPVPGLQTATVINPDYRQGSVVSLWAAREVLRRGGPVLLMDADVLYDGRLLGRLLASQHRDCLLLDRDIEPGDEPVKLCVRSGHIVDFRKRPTESHDWYGESVGFFRFTPEAAAELADRVEHYVEAGRCLEEYEEPIRDMIMASAPGRFGFEDITGLPWTEIDFPADVDKAAGLLERLAQ